jgi:hypothetical protein
VYQFNTPDPAAVKVAGEFAQTEVPVVVGAAGKPTVI